jgi:tetratricopeptide (TPR) repeat protein
MQRIFSAFVVVTALFAVGCGASLNEQPKHAGPQYSPLKDPNVMVEHAEVFAENGDFTRAQQYYSAALAAGGKSSAIMPKLLKACIASGDLRLATEYAEQELSKNPDDQNLRFVTGALQAQIGNRVAARDHLVGAAAQMKPNAKVELAVAAFFAAAPTRAALPSERSSRASPCRPGRSSSCSSP